MTWLVTGGAGYIGAHVCAAMQDAGEDVVVLDDVSTGQVRRLSEGPAVIGSVLEPGVALRAIRDHGIRGVVHLAAKKDVEESVRRPLHYYRQNVEGLRVLLDAVVSAGVESFVFSSSAAVYGAPDVDLVREDTDCHPVSPYGWTKLIGEQMVADVAAATGLRFTSLRYFNVAGAGCPELADRGAANLVPMVFERLTARKAPVIFGNDYATPDGTCVRDFVHVSDIASAHVAAARALADGRVEQLTANVGRGEGVSVREIIATIRTVTGTEEEAWAEPVVEARRPGDPPRSVAAVDVIRDVLGWRAGRGLDDIVASAWQGWTVARGMPCGT